ncbi:MAG: hypothetical protein V2A76_01415 [Planctomycetota bacterium]
MQRGGYGKEFLSRTILPEWWDDDSWGKQDILPEIELRVARFLGIPVSTVVDPHAALETPIYQGARLRRVRSVDRDRLGPAIHAGIRIAEAVVRNLRETVPDPVSPPPSGLDWRRQIKRSTGRVSLEGVLEDLWARGIPVLSADTLPSPSFQGLAAVVQGRPVILVGHKHDEPGRAAFRISHETGHIAGGDCAPGAPVVDEDEEITSEDEMEDLADRFALQVLVGGDVVPAGPPGGVHDFRELAKHAAALERETGADAGAVIFSWARATGDYATATRATQALYRATGAQRILREHLLKNLDLRGAPQSDRELLRAVSPDLEPSDAPAD